MPGMNRMNNMEDYETSVVELRHHNYAYSVDEITSGFSGRREACTVGELIDYLKTINPNAIVVISSDHSTVGQCYIEDIKRIDCNGYLIHDKNEDES